MKNPYRISVLDDTIVFCFRPTMLGFMVASNIAVSFTTPQQRGLWYTPLMITILVLIIVATKKMYGFKRGEL